MWSLYGSQGVRLTVEEDRETIRRYAHIKPGRAWGGSLCRAQCPGTSRTCTLERSHRGPHVAHGRFKRVVAVWDGGSGEPRRSGSGQRAVTPKVRGEVWTGGLGAPLGALWTRVRQFTPPVGDIALFVMLMAFLGFSVYWLRLIF